MESFDRSTTREYGDLSKDISSKYDTLKKSENEAIKQENEHYKSILKQVRRHISRQQECTALKKSPGAYMVHVYLYQLNVNPA